MIDINCLTENYIVRKLHEEDMQIVFDLYKDNDLYFSHLYTVPTIETVKEDMYALPKNITSKDKYYLGYYKDDELIGVIDLIDGYPNINTIYIGLFMLKKKHQGKTIGTSIINELIDSLKCQGKKSIKLSYVDTNPQACHFWHKLGFVEDDKKAKYLNVDITELEFIL